MCVGDPHRLADIAAGPSRTVVDDYHDSVDLCFTNATVEGAEVVQWSS